MQKYHSWDESIQLRYHILPTYEYCIHCVTMTNAVFMNDWWLCQRKKSIRWHSSEKVSIQNVAGVSFRNWYCMMMSSWKFIHNTPLLLAFINEICLLKIMQSNNTHTPSIISKGIDTSAAFSAAFSPALHYSLVWMAVKKMCRNLSTNNCSSTFTPVVGMSSVL